MKYILILIALVLPATLSMFQSGYYVMHDDMQLIRQIEMERCFQDGQIPCRWGSNLGYGYGYPIFNFYPPLPYLIGQFIRFVGFSFIDTVKVSAILQFYFAALAMFFLLKKTLGEKSALVGALFYTYAPYHFTNVYIRGAFNEAWASVFFPLVFLFTYNLACEKNNKFRNILLLSLSTVGILLSHNPMALLVAPFAAIWSLFWIYRSKNTTAFLTITLGGVLAICFSAFYTLPVIFESKYVQIETMFSNYYSFVAHFTSLKQLFTSAYWGSGPSFFGPKDGMSFSIGYLHWIIPSLVSLFVLKNIVFNKVKDKNHIPFFAIFTFGLISLFLSHEQSGFIWEKLTLLQKVQFPWRWLNISTFFLSLSCAYSVQILQREYNFKFFNLFAILGLILINISLAKPLQFGPLSESEKFSGQAWVNQVTSGIYDYLPKVARTAPKGPAGPGVDEVYPKEAFARLNANAGSDWNLISLSLKGPAQVYLSRFDFPGTVVYNNLQKISHAAEPELGRIVLNLDAGDHLLYVKLENTPIRTFSNILTLTTMLLITLFGLWKSKLFRK